MKKGCLRLFLLAVSLAFLTRHSSLRLHPTLLPSNAGESLSLIKFCLWPVILLRLRDSCYHSRGIDMQRGNLHGASGGEGEGGGQWRKE